MTRDSQRILELKLLKKNSERPVFYAFKIEDMKKFIGFEVNRTGKYCLRIQYGDLTCHEFYETAGKLLSFLRATDGNGELPKPDYRGIPYTFVDKVGYAPGKKTIVATQREGF